jgi:alkylation response protein AidB-like acyl-CoA dehydrogenase
MDFQFSEDQLLLQQTVRDFLRGECPSQWLREQWTTPTGRSPGFWSKLAEIGLPGLLVPEAQGGLGLGEIDLVLVLEEVGRAGLAEPIVATAAVAAPLLVELGRAGRADFVESWLGKIAAGDAIVAVGHSRSPFVADAHVADLLLLTWGDEIHALERGSLRMQAEKTGDGSERLFSLEWTPSEATRVAGEASGRALQKAAFDRGALACAAQQLGVAQQLIEMGALYATQRKQFGVAIGSFQAVKHRLANARVKLEYARAVVHRAACSVAHARPTRAVDVSMAKAVAGEAATFAAKESLQVHGAIGYTYEQDLHVWMKRAWSLDLAWGTGAWHRSRVAEAVLDGTLPASSFGYSPAA